MDAVTLYTNLTAMPDKPSTLPVKVCPRTTAPTPSGVPLKIRSPGASANKVDKFAMVSLIDQIKWSMVADCLVTPSTSSCIAAWPMSPASATRWGWT